jgi:hypothetical protein
MRYVLNAEHELECGVFARFRGRGDVNRVCEALCYLYNDELRWPGPEDGEALFDRLRLGACYRRLEYYETLEVLRVEDGAHQSAMRHAITMWFVVRRQKSAYPIGQQQVHVKCDRNLR